jgi:acyl carrier protein
MEQKLIDTVAVALGVSSSLLTLDSTPNDVEAWDSLSHINIVSEIEGAFGVSIPIERIVETHSIRDFLPYLGTKR